jgi:hypothetical protein
VLVSVAVGAGVRVGRGVGGIAWNGVRVAEESAGPPNAAICGSVTAGRLPGLQEASQRHNNMGTITARSVPVTLSIGKNVHA